jgi:hypothetical protein
MEAQKGYEAGSSLGLIEEERGAGGPGGGGDPGFSAAQVLKMSQAESLIEERDMEIKKVGLGVGAGSGSGELGGQGCEVCVGCRIWGRATAPAQHRPRPHSH